MPDQLDQYTAGKSRSQPLIYAFSDPHYPGMLKVGYTTRSVSERMDGIFTIKTPYGKKPYQVVFAEPAMREDGSVFLDHAVHRVLRKRGFANLDGEWFRCGASDVRAAWIAVLNHSENEENRDKNFAMRPEQKEAVAKTAAYFKMAQMEDIEAPKFLWNAKMRFGKTFAAYQLAKAMGLKRILILTFKPAVQSAWREDLVRHIDFEGWQFISNDPDKQELDFQYEQADKSRPIVCFGSFQDFLGINRETGGIKPKNEWVHSINWDLVIFDEYHFGAWKDSAKKLFEEPDEEAEPETERQARLIAEDARNIKSIERLNESWLPITADRYLYLSGTPFRALNSGEFIEEQIYNWTYSDEQQAKASWKGPDNPMRPCPGLYCLPTNCRTASGISSRKANSMNLI